MRILEKLDFLIDYLLRENQDIIVENIPIDIAEKKSLYRSLCNIRDAKPISREYIKIENEYLQEELSKKEITSIEDIKTIEESNLKNADRICLWKGDITTLKVDSIVNAANSQGLGCFIPCHKCIDNAIHSASGISLRLECNEKMQSIKKLETGKAFITKGYNSSCKYVIHTVGPIIYSDVTELEVSQLEECYINSLKLAIQNNIKTIAFPCISTGEFRFPKDKACQIAIRTVNNFLSKNRNRFEKVIFNVFSEEDYSIYFKEMKV